MERDGKDTAPEYAQVANELAGFYRGVNWYEESIHWFHIVLGVLERWGLSENEGYASAEMNCAGAFRLTGEPERAERMFLSAKGRMERLERTDSYVYNSILNNLALVYQAQNRLDEAETLVWQSLDWNRSQPESQHEVATALNNLAAIHQRTSHLDGAQALVEEALELYDRMEEPDVHHAAALETSAVLCLKQGKPKVAWSGSDWPARRWSISLGAILSTPLTVRTLRWY